MWDLAAQRAAQTPARSRLCVSTCSQLSAQQFASGKLFGSQRQNRQRRHARNSAKKKRSLRLMSQASEFSTSRASCLASRGDLIAFEVEAQLLRLTGLEADRLFLGQRAAAALQLDADGVAVPRAIAGESGRAEDAGLA